jgi:heme iron utilization protein
MRSNMLPHALPASIAVIVSTLLAGNLRAATPVESPCATPDQRREIGERFERPERGLVDQLRAELGISEAAVMSALPPGRAVGVPGSEFHAVWDSLRTWPDAVVAIRTGGHVMEVHGPIHAGEPSRISQYFNLSPEGPGLSGHLRPDLVAAIYAVQLPGRSGDEYGVVFFDPAGQPAFGVYVPSEHAKASDSALRAFEETKARLATMPRACGSALPSGPTATTRP